MFRLPSRIHASRRGIAALMVAAPLALGTVQTVAQGPTPGAAAAVAAASPTAQAVANDESWRGARAVAAELAQALSASCPLAPAGDQAAFDTCRRTLFTSDVLRERLNRIVLWGRQRNPDLILKDTGLTQFAPDVLTGMYLPLFMFNGEHTVQWVEREKLFQIRLATAFRNRLQPGQFPYPFWHEAEKWSMYQNASEVLLWWDPATTRVRVAQFTVHGGRQPLQAVQNVVPPSFDGRWMWNDAQGRAQPKVSLFDGLYRADNPYLGKLESSYKALALRLREGQCNNCHVPDNPDKSKRLVLLQTPAHAAGEVQRLLKSVRDDRMPRDETGIEARLDGHVKKALLNEGEAFAATIEAARRWEQESRAVRSAQQPTAAQP